MENFDMEDIKIAYTVNKVFLVIFELCVIIGGIVISVLLDVGIGLGVLFGGGFFCALLWIFSRIVFGFLCDVKVIRNDIEKLTSTNENKIETLKSSREDIPVSKKFRCYKCKAVFEFNEDAQIIICPNCGAKCKNPYYKE